MFLEALEFVKNRAFLPYQAAVEFFRNFDDELQKQADAYGKIAEHIKAMPGQIAQTLPRHPVLPFDLYQKWTAELVERIQKSINEVKLQYTNSDIHDRTLARVEDVFSGRVGKKPEGTASKLSIDECEARFAVGSPPGNLDAHKKGNDKYGDAIIWLELLALSKSQAKPIVFVTSEKKPDWWRLTASKMILGPRRELTQEMHEHSGQLFYMYSTDQFVSNMQKMLQFKPSTLTSQQSLAADVLAIDALRYFESPKNSLQSSGTLTRRLGSRIDYFKVLVRRASDIDTIYNAAMQIDSEWNNILRERRITPELTNDRLVQLHKLLQRAELQMRHIQKSYLILRKQRNTLSAEVYQNINLLVKTSELKLAAMERIQESFMATLNFRSKELPKT